MQQRTHPDPQVRSDPSSNRIGTRRWALTLGGVIAVGALVPWLIARNYGALGVARGDDWSYLRTLFTWVDSGRLDFNHWVSMTLLGQLTLARPIAMARPDDIAAVQTLTTVFGAIALAAITAMGRIAGRSLQIGALLALCVAALPFWGALTTNFMTDVPACACSMTALAVAMYAFRHDTVSMPRVYAALAIGVLGFTIREYAAIPVAAIACTTMALLHRHGRRREFVRLVAVTAAIVVGACAFLVYWRTIPNPKALDPHVPTGKALLNVIYKCSGMPRIVGLALWPLLLIRGPRRIVERARAANPDATFFFTLGALAWFSYTAVVAPRVAFAGNYFVPDGLLGRDVSAGVRPDVVPMPVFALLIALGTAGAILIMLAALPTLSTWRRKPRRDRWTPSDPVAALCCVTLLGYTAIYVVAAATGLPLYDRYVLPAVAVVGCALLCGTAQEPLPHGAQSLTPSRPTRRVALSAWMTLVALTALGTIYTLDSASFDAARWHAATQAVAAGWAPSAVGGNFEWVNTYSSTPGSFARRRARVCVAVIVGAKPSADPHDVYGHTTYRPPFHDPIPVLALRTPLPCPTPVPHSGEQQR